MTDGGVGLAVEIMPYKDKMIVIGEKGISAYIPADGKFLYSGKYKTAQLEDVFDNILIMKTEKADIASFDLDSGKFKEFKARPVLPQPSPLKANLFIFMKIRW